MERARPVGRRRRDGPGAGLRAGRAGRLRRLIPAASVELLNVSENATFLVSDPDTGPSVLRVHRLGYHTEQEIASELAWMDALRAEAGVRTPRVLPAADGRRVVTVPEAGGAAERYCVRFEFLPGHRAGAGRGVIPADRRALRRAGGDHRADAPARAGVVPPGLVHPVPLGLPGGVRRPGALGPVAGRHRGRAGRARDPDPAGRRAARPAACVRLRAGPVRAGPRRHPAGQPAGRTTARSASSTSTTPGSAGTCTTWAPRSSFIEHQPARAGAGATAGSRATARCRPARPPPTRPRSGTFVMLRRLLLVAWIGSHRAVATSPPNSAPAITAGTCDLAESYLSTHSKGRCHVHIDRRPRRRRHRRHQGHRQGHRAASSPARARTC